MDRPHRAPRVPAFPWALAALVAVAVAFLVLTVDRPLSAWIADAPALGFLEFFSFMGGASIQLVLLMIVLSDDHWMTRLRGWALPMAAALALSTLLKYGLGRARPELELGALHFRSWQPPGSHFNSFPSGDAASAMVAALLLGFYFPRARGAFWLMAVLAGLGRVEHGSHFVTDALGGFALGGLCVWFAIRMLGPEPYRPHRSARAGSPFPRAA